MIQIMFLPDSLIFPYPKKQWLAIVGCGSYMFDFKSSVMIVFKCIVETKPRKLCLNIVLLDIRPPNGSIKDVSITLITIDVG